MEIKDIKNQSILIIILFLIIVFLIILNGARIKKAFNNGVNNNTIETEDQAENKQEENYIEKNLEAIKIIKNEVINITYGQGCLIKSGTTILFGPDDKGDAQKIKDFKKPYKVTSHGYVHCSEIIGKLSNGDKFYIHAQSILGFEKTLYSIVEEAQKEFNEEITVSKIEIKNDPSAYSKEEIVLEKNKAYREKCKSLGILDKNIETKSERFTETTPEKISGY